MHIHQQHFVWEEAMPLSVQLHRLPVSGENLWVWHVLPEINSQVDEQTLRMHGWELVEPVTLSCPILALMSQLASALPVLSMGKTVIKTWVRTEDLAETAAHPVILAFRYQEQYPEQPVMVARPPLGELGIVLEDDQLHIYQIEMLGEEGGHWSEQLQHAIRMLTSTQNVSIDDPEWKAAQQAARHLAALYWDLHRHREEGTTIDVDQTTVIPVTEKKPKRTRGPRREAAPLVIRDPEAVEISTDHITQALLRGLLSDDLYALYPDRLVAEHRRVFPTDQGEVKITIRPGSQETWTHVLESLSILGDAVVDTFCALVSLAYDASSQHDLTQSFFLNVDDILRVCRRKQSNRAYTPLQRASVIEHLITLSRVHVTATIPGKRGGRKTSRFIDSVVLDLLGTVIGEYETLTGDILWERREVKIGPWAKFAPFGPQTALLFRTILEYHSQRQRYAKRIGRYLTIQFFLQAQSAPGSILSLEMSAQELLEQSGIKPDLDNPSRTRKMIEEPFKLLQKDKVIGSYARVISAPPAGETAEQQEIRMKQEQDIQRRIDECAQGWWLLYTAQRWRFEAPSAGVYPLLPPGSDL
jgi:hypothetical protein